MIRSNYSDEDTKDEERNELSRQRMTVTGLTDIVGVHHTNSVPPVLTMTARTLVVHPIPTSDGKPKPSRRPH
jgi:hypothetical protein